MTVGLDDSGGSQVAVEGDVTDLTFSTPRGVQDSTGVDSSANTRILLLRRYPDRITYNELRNEEIEMDSGPAEHTIRGIEVFPTTGEAHILYGNATEGLLRVIGLPPPCGAAMPWLRCRAQGSASRPL